VDNQRFDRISRLIAKSASRREALKGIAALIGGGAIATVAGNGIARAQETGDVPPGGDCTDGSDCTTGLCNEGGICYCVNPDEPLNGCPCTTGTDDPCGAGTLLCCPTSDEPGGPGICTRDSIGCNPTGECTSDPGGSCESDADCCQGSCSEEGVCYCEDPSRPWIGCSCNSGTESPCGGGTTLCCPSTDEPGAAGICTSDSVGCNPTGECTSDAGGSCETDADCCEGSCSDDGVCYCLDPAEPQRGCACITGTEAPCGSDTLLCCPTTDQPGGPGICTPDRLGCEPTGCRAEGQSCEVAGDCCSDLICDSGTCITEQAPEPDVTPTPSGGGDSAPVTTLPSTGAGDGDGNSSEWLGVAALGGAAAIAAGLLRKDRKQSSNDA
jgi:hypothetical protein